MAAAPIITKAFQWDLARQVERLDFLLKWLPRYADWGYQELYLHLEDAVEYPSLPAVARADAYTYKQMTRLVNAATAAGLRVVPIVNLLGHTQYLIKVPGLRDLNELRDAAGRPRESGQICPLHPRTPEVAGKLLRDMAPFCTAGKVHVGLDESFHLGQCPRCRAEIARQGLAGHFAGHVGRLHQLTQSLGLRLGLWADMLALLPAAIPRLPRDVIAYDWYYYPFARHPRVELRNFAEVDLAPPLQARGIEYWGCPMNGAFRSEPMPIFGERLQNILSWWRRCRCVGANGFLVTSWEANRLAIELTTAVDAAAACLWLDPDVDDPREMLARGFERAFGGIQVGRLVPKPPRRVRDPAFARGFGGQVNAPHPAEARHWAGAAMACDKYAFSGYHRWQINDRWDVCAGRDGAAPYEKELRAIEKIYPVGAQSCCALSNGRDEIAPLLCAPPLAVSIVFRRYLAQRDVFVRRNARAVFQLRREIVRSAVLQPALGAHGRGLKHRATLNQLRHEAAIFAAALRAGRAAARAMWNRSRDPHARGPNELMLARDAERLRTWQQWLGKAARNLDIIWQATPVCGAWQLQFTVHNFAPALQRVVVEQRQPDGSWQNLHGLPLMEFRAQAAHPRTRIRREFSVPIAVDTLVGARSCRALATGRSKPAPLQSHDTEIPAATAQFPSLRLAVRGVGQVAVSHVELTNGVVRLHPSGWLSSHEKILGRPACSAKANQPIDPQEAQVATQARAPRRGFPAVDFEKNTGSATVSFVHCAS